MSDERRLTFMGLLRSVGNAIRGIGILLRSQHNAWIHVVATLAVCVAGVLCGLAASQWCWIVLAITAVWTAEALNTAIEFLTDVASPGFHPIAGKAKDVSAGAVLLATIGAVIIGVIVFGPHLLDWWRN